MAELSLGCLPVGMTSMGKNVYPVSTSSDDADTNHITAECLEGNEGIRNKTNLFWDSTKPRLGTQLTDSDV